MRIGCPKFSYDWIEHWARIPNSESGRANGRTHGVVVLGNGDVWVADGYGSNLVHRYNKSGPVDSIARTAWP